MTVDNKLAAEARTEFGKGAARRVRRDNKIPAVLYGHGTDPVHIALPYHQTALLLRQANILLELIIDGAKPVLALPKQIQRDPVKNVVEHIDLLLVKRGEKVAVDVPVVLVGEARSATVVVDAPTLGVMAEATHVPESFEINIDGMEPGVQILAKDVVLPNGVELNVDPEMLVVNISAMTDQPVTPDLGGDAPAVEAEEAAE